MCSTSFVENSKQIKSLHENLLRWYRKHQRKLPWRETKNPYFIWISEVMLQQTRVETVTPYYLRFTEKFPTVASLASASEDSVLKNWQGLGYYRRAKLIHKAAKEVVEKYSGQLPQTQQALETLPGFGPYTSGAVASIAFGEPVAAVDGNVKRVLSRIFATHESIERIAEQAADVDSPSEWTQALMELGALICIPKSPKCLICPVQLICKANASGTVGQFPVKIKKANVKKIYATTWIIEQHRQKKILIQQRPHLGRYAGMWEFPSFESEKKSVSAFPGISINKSNFIGSFVHQLTHRTIYVDVQHVQSDHFHPKKDQRWISQNQISEFPISRMQQRAWEMFKAKI